MTRWTANWSARVDRQEIECDADTEEEARHLLEQQMNPRQVVELVDFELDDLEEHPTDDD